MAKLVGGLLRTLATLFYFLDFCCAAVILGVYSYFLAKLSYHDEYISKDWRAVEGLGGSAVLYSIFAVILTCFLGGVRFFAFIAIILDLLFCGAMVAVAVLVRQASHGCKGTVTTPLGHGLTSNDGAGTNLGLACRLNIAVFATAIAGAVFFLISALLQVLVARHHQKEKKYGPSPANDYTSGSGKRKFYQRKPKTVSPAEESEMPVVPVVATTGGLAVADRTDMRPSHDTAYTGTTMGQNDTYGNANTNKYVEPPTKYEAPQTAPPVQAQRLGPNGQPIISTSTSTQPGYYDPYYNPNGQTGTATNY